VEEVPNGFISKKEFSKLTELMGIKDKLVSDLIFTAFDKNHDSNIEFKEFMQTISVMTRGDPDEKLTCKFLNSFKFECFFNNKKTTFGFSICVNSCI